MCSLLQFLVHLFNSIILYVQTYKKYLDVYDINSIESTRSIFKQCSLTRLIHLAKFVNDPLEAILLDS